MFKRLRIVSDAWKASAHLHGGRQVPLLLEDGADCGSIGLGDNEHGGNLGRPGGGFQAPIAIGPGRKPEPPPGPFARLGCIVGMEIPGAFTKTAIRKVASVPIRINDVSNQ